MPHRLLKFALSKKHPEPRMFRAPAELKSEYDAVIIGGGITQAGELLFQPLREELFEILSYPFVDHLMVQPSSFGVDGVIIGAAALAFEMEHLGN